jgi:hypothetical protein
MVNYEDIIGGIGTGIVIVCGLIGALLGTAVCPLIGTVIGGFVGGVGGAIILGIGLVILAIAVKIKEAL